MSVTTMRGSMSRLALASERDSRCSGNRVGLGNAEPKATVFGSLIESRTENTSSLTSTSVDSLTWLLITGSENGLGAWALTK
ncbi:hypothetical protein D3C84_1027240 [compost metagenome]